MPYKDKKKQKEANRLAKQRARKGMTGEEGVIPEDVIPDDRRITFSDDGSVLDLDAVERNRDNLTKLIKYMNGDGKAKKYMKDIRFGVSGCTLDRVGVAIGVIGG